jgi:hypothetical protein
MIMYHDWTRTHIESYTTSQSLQTIFAKQISTKENLSLSVLENAFVSLGNYLPIFSAHGRDQSKIEGRSFTIKFPLNLHSYSTQNLVNPHQLNGQYLLWIISRRICITKPWLLEHWVPHCCVLNRKHVSKHPWAELVIWTYTCHGNLSILKASSQKNLKHLTTYYTLKGRFYIIWSFLKSCIWKLVTKLDATFPHPIWYCRVDILTSEGRCSNLVI